MFTSSDVLPFDSVENDKTRFQALQPLHPIRPGLQAVPHAIQMDFLVLAQIVDIQLHQQIVEDHPVQRIDLGPRQLAARHTVHRRPVTRAPRIGKPGPVHAQSLGLAPCATVPDEAAAKISASAKDIEGERLDIACVDRHHAIHGREQLIAMPGLELLAQHPFDGGRGEQPGALRLLGELIGQGNLNRGHENISCMCRRCLSFSTSCSRRSSRRIGISMHLFPHQRLY